MANALEFILSLRDRLTAPAKQAKAALDGVQRSLKGVDAATGKVANVTRKVTRATGLSERQLYRWGATSRVAGRVADLLGQRLGAGTAIGFARAQVAASSFAARLPSMGTMLGHVGAGVVSLGPALLALGTALFSIGAGGLGLIAVGARYAAEMAGFKEQTLFAFKYVLGGQQRAAMMFNEADDLARAMGTKTSTVAESMRELLAGGFSESQSRDITAAIADVAALNPTANVGAISTQLAQMKGAGRVLAEDLKPLLNAGLNDETFYQVLREMKGLGNAPEDQQRLKKMLEQGKVSADQGIQAIMETVNRMGGKKGLGSVAAARATDTVQGQIDNAKAMFERLFMGIQSGPAGSAVGKLAAQVASFLDPKGASGERLLAVFDRIAAVIGQLLDSLSKGTLGAVFDGLLTVMETLLPIGLAFWDGLSTGFGEAFAAVKQIFAAFSGGQGPTLQFAEIARDLGKAFAFVAIGIGSVVALLTAIGAGVALVVVGIGRALVDLVGWVGEMAAEWGSLGLEIASALVKGLVDGITGGIASVVDAVGNLGTAAIDGLKSLLQIKSPSRVMAELGGFTAEGFARGVTAGAPDASSAVERMVGAPQVRSFGGAGGGAFSMGDISIAINGVAIDDAEAVGAAVRDQVEEAMRQAFQRWAGELGAAPQGA